LFLLGDQPQTPSDLLNQLVHAHWKSKPAIVAPRVSGQRANPVLFDQSTFPDLLELQGDVGGRAVFKKHDLLLIDWEEDGQLFDVDTPEDYQNLLAAYKGKR
jgi:molybdenum cofactor cytidylyltransferase